MNTVIKYPQIFKIVIVSVLPLLIIGCSESPNNSTKNITGSKPNIVIILADDLGYGDVGSYNPKSKIPTPNLDELAEEGIRFTDAHSPSAVCTPTRYGLLTGRYSWRTRLKKGVFGGYNLPLIDENRMTLASMLQGQGYQTATTGKWHLGLEWALKEGNSREDQLKGHEAIDFSSPLLKGPNDLGFNYFFGTSGNPTDDPPLFFIENKKIIGNPDSFIKSRWWSHEWDWESKEPPEFFGIQGWEHEKADTTYMNRAISFIENSVKQNPDTPFFLYHALSAPHVPWHPPGFVRGKSEAGSRGDLVYLTDWVTGKIDSTLDALGVKDNTLFIFTSDNGARHGVYGHRATGNYRGHGHRSTGNFRGQKGQIWEGGHRVPFIARWPGIIEPGTESDELIGLNDLMATIAAITDKKLSDDAAEDSYNILPALLGKELDSFERPGLIHHSGAGVFAIRKGKWKLIVNSLQGGYRHPADPESPGQLYNMEADPYETNNLFYAKPEKVSELTNLLNKYTNQGYSVRY